MLLETNYVHDQTTLKRWNNGEAVSWYPIRLLHELISTIYITLVNLYDIYITLVSLCDKGTRYDTDTRDVCKHWALVVGVSLCAKNGLSDHHVKYGGNLPIDASTCVIEVRRYVIPHPASRQS